MSGSGSITGHQQTLDRLGKLQTSITPILRKMLTKALKVIRPVMASKMPKAKKARKVKGVWINPGLTQGAVGDQVWVEKADGTTRGKVGLNVDRTRAPSMTSGIPGTHKSYYGPWNILGTEPRYTGYKTKRSTVNGVKLRVKNKTGNPIRYTGQLRPRQVIEATLSVARAPAKAAAQEVLNAAIKGL